MDPLTAALRDLVRAEVRSAVEDLVVPVIRQEQEDQVVPELMTLGETQRLLAASWDLVDRLITTGELVAVQVGDRRRIDRASLIAYIAQNRVDAV